MQPLNKTNLADTATEAIRSEIFAKRWAVGEKLPNEATLSAMSWTFNLRDNVT